MVFLILGFYIKIMCCSFLHCLCFSAPYNYFTFLILENDSEVLGPSVVVHPLRVPTIEVKEDYIIVPIMKLQVNLQHTYIPKECSNSSINIPHVLVSIIVLLGLVHIIIYSNKQNRS